MELTDGNINDPNDPLHKTFVRAVATAHAVVMMQNPDDPDDQVMRMMFNLEAIGINGETLAVLFIPDHLVPGLITAMANMLGEFMGAPMPIDANVPDMIPDDFENGDSNGD